MKLKDGFTLLWFGNADKAFFDYHNKLISQINKKTVKYLNTLAFIFSTILALIYLIPDNKITTSVFYLTSALVFGVLTIFSFSLIDKYDKVIHPLFWMFEITCSINIYFESVISNTLGYSVVFYAIGIILPMIYVAKPWQSMLELLIYYIVYFILIFIYKSKDILTMEIIYAVLFYFISNIVIIYVRNLHVSALQASILFKKEAQIDKLTNLYNKSAIELYCHEVLEANNNPLALAIIDVDNFKLVNDRWGHSQGDIFLSQVSSILLKTFQNNGVVGRIGGDEFLVLVENVYDTELLKDRINKVLENISTSFIDYSNEQITCSCGVALREENEKISFALLFENADRALYIAKQNGKNQCVLYKSNEYAKGNNIILALNHNASGESVLREYIGRKHKMLFFNNLSEALVDYNEVALIIFDCSNYDLTGVENVRDLFYGLDKSVSIIATSINNKDANYFLNKGFDVYLPIPCSRDTCESIVDDLISKRVYKNE